jgi:polysaccharide biosynthesis/export protein
VFQVPNLTKSVQVSDTGTVNLPLVGEIPVIGKTPQEVERDLTARLGAKYVQNPQVTVYVKEYNSQSVTITGAVAKPGVYSIKGKASLLQVVAMAGGLGPVSDSTVLLLRQSNGKRLAPKFDVSAIQDGKADDPAVQSGDQLLAGTSAIKQGFNTILKGLPLAGTAKNSGWRRPMKRQRRRSGTYPITLSLHTLSLARAAMAASSSSWPRPYGSWWHRRC